MVIGFFKDVTAKDALAFLAVAETQDSVTFGITSTQEVADALDATFDSIVLFKKVREGGGREGGRGEEGGGREGVGDCDQRAFITEHVFLQIKPLTHNYTYCANSLYEVS